VGTSYGSLHQIFASGRGAFTITKLANSVDEWLGLCRRYRGDAQQLVAARRSDGAWFNAGLAVECCLKAAIMRKDGLNRWPGRDEAPDLWTHDLRDLFRKLGIDLDGLHRAPVAPALKTVLDWRREHGYAVGKVPLKNAQSMCEAAFESDGVVEWLASLYRLNI
jgi:HEPN domain-containing protein